MYPEERRLVVKQSCIEIHDYEFGDCPTLEGFFKMFDIVTHSYYFLGLYYDTRNKVLKLPRGIDVEYIERLLGVNAYIDHKYDRYSSTAPIMINTLPRDDRQSEALRFMLGMQEYEATKYKSQLQLNLNTGVGKTYVAVATAAYEELSTIIITYSVGWLKQWSEKIQEYTDISKREIMMICGSPAMNRILNGKFNPKKFYLITHSTIESYATTYGWDKITELFKKLQIGLKFYDEAHMNFANMCMIDFYTNTYKTYYLTATPMRSDNEENKKYKLYMKNVLSIDLFDEDNDPHTHYLAFIYNSKPSALEISNCKNMYGLNRAKYVEILMKKENFWKICHIMMDFMLKLNGKILLYIATNEAICIFYDWLIDNYPFLKGDIGIYTSLVDTNKELEKEKRVILSTTKSAGAAEDISGLKATCVVAEPFKSEVIARQTLGRTRDNNTFYIELVDLGFKQTRRFYYSKLPVFEKYALDVQHIQFPQYDLDKKSQAIIDQLNEYSIQNKYVDTCLICVIDFEQPEDLIEPFTIEKSGMIEPFEIIPK